MFFSPFESTSKRSPVHLHQLVPSDPGVSSVVYPRYEKVLLQSHGPSIIITYCPMRTPPHTLTPQATAKRPCITPREARRSKRDQLPAVHDRDIYPDELSTIRSRRQGNKNWKQFGTIGNGLMAVLISSTEMLGLFTKIPISEGESVTHYGEMMRDEAAWHVDPTRSKSHARRAGEGGMSPFPHRHYCMLSSADEPCYRSHH
jgi:hypothetical protein